MRRVFFLRIFFMHIGLTTVTAVTYSCLTNETCGCSQDAAVLTKIVGGEQAKKDSWGWAVSIRVGEKHICGGSLISTNLILTAAHCLISLKSKSSLRINVGSKNLSTIRQQRGVSEIYIHGDYDSNTFINDIAMIRLASAINMTDRSIALICLPAIMDVEYPAAGEPVVAIGWGVLAAEDKTASNTLQQVTLEVISSSLMICQRSVNNEDLQFCAGVQGGGKGIEKTDTLIRIE